MWQKWRIYLVLENLASSDEIDGKILTKGQKRRNTDSHQGTDLLVIRKKWQRDFSRVLAVKDRKNKNPL